MSCIFCGGQDDKHNSNCWLTRLQGLEVRDKNNYELIMSHDTMIKNLCALLNTSYPPSHRPEGDTLKSLQKEAAKLIQQVINEWGPLPVVGPLNNTRYYEYKEACERWLHGPGGLDAAWGLITNAFGGDWDKCTDVWKSRARDWERRWHAFEKFSTPTVQAAVIAGQGDTIASLTKERDLLKNDVERYKSALETERAINLKLGRDMDRLNIHLNMIQASTYKLLRETAR